MEWDDLCSYVTKIYDIVKLVKGQSSLICFLDESSQRRDDHDGDAHDVVEIFGDDLFNAGILDYSIQLYLANPIYIGL